DRAGEHPAAPAGDRRGAVPARRPRLLAEHRGGARAHRRRARPVRAEGTARRAAGGLTGRAAHPPLWCVGIGGIVFAVTTERATLLIADIGGYTDYMGSHRMTLAHAEVNTARMLERMVDAAPGFELIEIEGDAA